MLAGVDDSPAQQALSGLSKSYFDSLCGGTPEIFL
jgi:hypothetical protein